MTSGFFDVIELNGSHYLNESSSLLGAEKRRMGGMAKVFLGERSLQRAKRHRSVKYLLGANSLVKWAMLHKCCERPCG